MKLRCKPGDLAIVTGASYDCNLGLVVQVVEPAPIEHPLRLRSKGHSWWVKSRFPMFYTKGDLDQCFFLIEGPVPDAYLTPIGTEDPVLDSQEEVDRTLMKHDL